MAVRRLAAEQPASFAFTEENLAWAREQLAKYPDGRQASAVIPILWRAQEQAGGWVPQKAIEYVAEFLDMATIRVLEVATFYTMFNLEPVGRYHVQLCGTTPCMLRGSEDLKTVCRERIGEQHHVTPDGMFSWVEVECLAACVNAPMVQINADYYEDLTPESFSRILDELAAGRSPRPGPQVDRQLSAPIGGLTTLTDSSIYPALEEHWEPEPMAASEAAALTDDAAKKPGEAASRREEPAPKPPARDSSQKQRTKRRE
jgi:NADH-quinone oxidoreductase subunit E